VQLGLETRANGRHRAEVQKLMVLPECRLRGIAAKLMTGIEAEARKRGVRLLFLDTSEGDSGATAFYSKNAYTYVGGIPDYALDPDGKPSKNAIFYKQLA
jgi:ribosomal protein S18 acetylase RimI-like enzyme